MTPETPELLETLEDGIALAETAIDNGEAAKKLEALAAFTQENA